MTKSFRQWVTEGDKCERIKKHLEKLRAAQKKAGDNVHMAHGANDPRGMAHFEEEYGKLSKEIAKAVEAKKKEGCS